MGTSPNTKVDLVDLGTLPSLEAELDKFFWYTLNRTLFKHVPNSFLKIVK